MSGHMSLNDWVAGIRGLPDETPNLLQGWLDGNHRDDRKSNPRPVPRATIRQATGGMSPCFASYGPTWARCIGWVRVLNGTVTTALALMFHEMATNAVRYGALSAPSGRLSLHWSCEADHVTLQLGCTT